MALSLSGTTGIVTGNIAALQVTTATIADNNVTPGKLSQPMTLGTTQNATGTSVDFTGIPSWVKRITVSVNSLSTNSTSIIIARIGSGSYMLSGYAGAYSTSISGASGTAQLSNGFIISVNNNSGSSIFGSLTIVKLSGNDWNAFGSFGWGNEQRTSMFGGSISVTGGNLDRVGVTTVNGTDLFDAGTINIMYEG